MANKITNTIELERVRKKLLKQPAIAGFWAWLIVFLICVLYVTLAVLGRGSYLLPNFFTKLGMNQSELLRTWNVPAWLQWAGKLPYYNTLKEAAFIPNGMEQFKAMFTFKGSLTAANDIFFRWLTIFLMIVLSINVALIVRVIVKKRNYKRYKNIYWDTLYDLAGKENGVRYHAIQKDLDLNQYANAINRTVATDLKPSLKLNFADEKLNFDFNEGRYDLNGETRVGVLCTFKLIDRPINGLIQFRNFGKLYSSEFEGNKIKKLGFSETNIINDFVLYSSLESGTYNAVDYRLAKAISDLRDYIPVGIVVNVEHNELAIYLDGFEINFVRPIKEKLQDNFLERQADTINSFFKLLTNVYKCFSIGEFVMENIENLDREQIVA